MSPLKPINLAVGWPSVYLYPQELLLDSSQTVFSSPDLTESAGIYGPDPGQESVRKHVAEWLSKHFCQHDLSNELPKPPSVTTDRILISNGASANLGAILVKFTDPLYTKYIWIVEPTYYLACPIFEDGSFVGRLRGVPEDDEGIDLEFLKRGLQEVDSEAKDPGRVSETNTQSTGNGGLGDNRLKTGPNYPKCYRHIIYCVPSFSNPTGKTMSLRRRKELVQLARDHDALVISDDVYDFLRWSGDLSLPHSAQLGPPPPRLVDYDRMLPGQSQFGNTVSNGSFSKIIAPGVRTSWTEGTPAFIHALSTVGYTRSGGAPSQMVSIMIDQFLQNGELDRHIQQVLIPTYAARSRAMLQIIESELVPLGVKISAGVPYRSPSDNGKAFPPQTGGYFTYIVLPSNLPSASEVCQIALKRYALKLNHAHNMIIPGDPGSSQRVDPRGVRFCWSWHSEKTIVKGVKRFSKLIRNLVSEDGKLGDDVHGVIEDEQDDDDEADDSGVDAYFQSN